MLHYPTTPAGFAAARPIRAANRAGVFKYTKMASRIAIGSTRKVNLPRRPFIRSKNNTTGKAEYPDYIFAALADVANIR